MEPTDYSEYSAIFDLLSSPDFFPVLNRFANEIVLPNLKPDARVTDIGAGTGLLCEILLGNLPNLQLTLIDPTQKMLDIAKDRLGGRVKYLQMTIDSAIDRLPPQDAFIFQRSLYVIYQNEMHCKNLFKKLHDKLSNEGIIFILDFSQKYNIEEYKSFFLEVCAKTPETREELSGKFGIIEKTLKTFNTKVDEGEFHLFATRELEELMASAGFKPLISGVDDCYAFQRIAMSTK